MYVNKCITVYNNAQNIVITHIYAPRHVNVCAYAMYVAELISCGLIHYAWL